MTAKNNIRTAGNKAPDSATLIFAGTTEGRLLAEYAAEIGMGCYVSTATEYGKEVLGEHPGIRVLSGRMDQEQIEGFLKEKDIRLVIDATHPFAIAATENIRAACGGTGVRYVRCLREESRNPGTYVSVEGSGDRPEDQKRTGADGSGEMIVVDSVRQAVDYLKTTQGNILIATGSKELRLSLPGAKSSGCIQRSMVTRIGVSPECSPRRKRWKRAQNWAFREGI